MQERLLAIYDRLINAYGRRDWWPADTPFEVVVGAVLTQNTSWKNVETAIENLKKRDLVHPDALARADVELVRELIRPARYFNQKAVRIMDIAAFIRDDLGGDVTTIAERTLVDARKTLLGKKGVGPETADAILLYAAGMPTFVIDTYTVRVFTRMGLTEETRYEPLRSWFMEHLPGDVSLYNEYHALIDAHGHYTCKPKPLCDECVLADMCEKRL